MFRDTKMDRRIFGNCLSLIEETAIQKVGDCTRITEFKSVRSADMSSGRLTRREQESRRQCSGRSST